MMLRGKHLVLLLVLAAGLAAAFPVLAGEAEKPVPGFRATDLPLPRFVSLKSDRVYVRAGPALRYPIKWVYERSRLPVEIVQEFENWRKVRDFSGEEGWIHEAMLSGERTALVKTSEIVPLRERGDVSSRMVARVEPMVVTGIEECGGDWCRVDAGGYRGWVERNFLWGIYEAEEIN